MANVAIFGQMPGGSALSVRANCLIERVTVGKLWVQFLAEFTGAAGANFESFADGWIKVFHECSMRDRGDLASVRLG